MKPLASTMTEVDTLPGEEVQFGIADARWVMRSLADLYSNRELAVIREYSTNAYDAHIMCGRADVPIEVSLPTNTDPYFRVKDTGIGMSQDVLKNRYTQFGDSDKRERNDINGMLGFGCKSAVAYTTQFTVTSVCDGFKTIAVITRKPDFSIVLKVVSHSKTTERNGTTVEVPVSDIAKFNHMAMEFFKYWRPGTVLVNGVEPEHAVGEQIDDHLYYSTNHGTSYVVMGNVAYRIANPDFLFRQKRINPISFVAYVDHLSDDDGPAIEHTPSREDLKYSARTNETLNKVIGGFIEKMMEQAKKELAKATTYFDAYVTYSEWSRRLGSGVMDELTFKGEKFMNHFEIKGTRYIWGETGGYGTRRIENYSVSDMSNTLIITEFDMTLNSGHKAKARQYTTKVDGTPHATKYIFTADAKVKCKWIDPKRIVKWEDLKAAVPKPVRTSSGYTGRTRLKGTFDYYTTKGLVAEKPLPEDDDLFYITVQESKRVDVTTALKCLGWDKAAVIRLASNRVEKFKRDNPSVKNFTDEAKKKVVIKGIDLLDADAKFYLGLAYKVRQWADVLDVAQVKDPEWKRIKELSKRTDLTKKYDENFNLAHAVGMRYDIKTHGISSDNGALLSKYPILEYLSTYNRPVMADIVLYMNAAYEKAQKGN